MKYLHDFIGEEHVELKEDLPLYGLKVRPAVLEKGQRGIIKKLGSPLSYLVVVQFGSQMAWVDARKLKRVE